MSQVAQAFEELKTDGLKVTKTIDDVINWVKSDRNLLSDQAQTEETKKNKF